MIRPLHIDLNDSSVMGAHPTREDRELSVHLDIVSGEHSRESALFALVAEGSETAFRELFRLYSPLFSYIIHKVTGDSSFIPDCLQDAFLKIWLKRDMLVSVEHPRKWAMQIVYHLCFNHLKHKQIAQKHLYRVVHEQTPVPKQNAVEKVVFHRETEQALKSIILQLPPQTQKIYRLSREEGMDAQQISDYLHLSVQTVKNTLCRSLKMIRALLNEKGIIVSLFYLLMALPVPVLLCLAE